jgi:hypothetical protein
MKISLALNSNVSRRGRGPQKSKSTLLRAGLPKNRYDSFCFSNNSFLPSFLLAAAAAAQKRKGGNVSIFLSLYKVQCFTKDEIHI